MVTSQNGDHRNGHVLVENQQTRLEADNEAHEATSKSKSYRAHICLLSGCQKKITHRHQHHRPHMSYGNTCDVSC
jgi:hypothetical protein